MGIRCWGIGLLVGLGGLGLAGCGDGGVVRGAPSGAVCPGGSTLTFDTFGKGFMDKYCTGCHSQALVGAARHGAPSDHNFDSLANVRAVGAEHIDLAAASGPAHTNVVMPPAGRSQPSLTERQQLGEWLACGIP